MTQGPPHTDWPQLAAELREVYDAVDPVPPEVLAVASGAIAWRSIDADLAALVADSADTDDRLAGVRDGGGARLVTFEADGVVIEVEVAETGDTRRLLGQVIPAATASVVVETPAATTAVDVDALGRFSVTGVGRGPVRLTCRLRDGDHHVVTSWITI